MDETVLPRRAALQPQPGIYTGGDDGPCVLAGLLSLTPHAVYRRFMQATRAVDYAEMRTLLAAAERAKLVDRVVLDPPTWLPDRAVQVFGSPAYLQNLPWFRYVRMAIDAGYYGVALVDTQSNGGTGYRWALVRGARIRDEPTPSGEGIIHHYEILVSFPSGREEWIASGEFLAKRGGFNLFLTRPTQKYDEGRVIPFSSRGS